MQSTDLAEADTSTRSTRWARAALGVAGACFGLYWALLLIDFGASSDHQGRDMFTTLAYVLAVLLLQLVCMVVAAILGQRRERLVALALGAIWFVTLVFTWFGGFPVPVPG